MIDGDREEIRAVAELPVKPFRLTWVDLRKRTVGSDDLACLKDCPELAGLVLAGSNVDDAGLARLEGIVSLRNLNLEGTNTGDAGLAGFKGCARMSWVHLGETRDGGRAVGAARFPRHVDAEPERDTGGEGGRAIACFKLGKQGIAAFGPFRSILLDLRRIGPVPIFPILKLAAALGKAGLERLKGHPTLNTLHLPGGVTDLSPLAELKLRSLSGDIVPARDAGILRGIGSLITINGKPAAEVLGE